MPAYKLDNFDTDTSNNLNGPKYESFTAEFWVRTHVNFNKNGAIKSDASLNAIFQQVETFKDNIVYRTKGWAANQLSEYTNDSGIEQTAATFNQMAIYHKNANHVIDASEKIFTGDSLSLASNKSTYSTLSWNGQTIANPGFARKVYANVSIRSDDNIGRKMLGTVAFNTPGFEDGLEVPTGYAFGYIVNRKVDGIPGTTYDDKITGTKIGVLFIQDSIVSSELLLNPNPAV
uniref:Uncharacterized protein n=1 Tax=viral metagenome TaxID=1070528 RepID=A0A6C0E5V8_9ZZZZ